MSSNIDIGAGWLSLSFSFSCSDCAVKSTGCWSMIMLAFHFKCVADVIFTLFACKKGSQVKFKGHVVLDVLINKLFNLDLLCISGLLFLNELL